MAKALWPSLSVCEELVQASDGEVPSCLSFKANREVVAALGLSSDGAGPAVERGAHKRRRLEGVTVSFDTRSSGVLRAGDAFSAPFEVAFGREGDASVTECFAVDRATPTRGTGVGTVVGKMQIGRSGNDQKAFAVVSGAYRANAAKRSKTKQLAASATFKTSLSDFAVPPGGASGGAVPVTTDAELTARAAEYADGRRQFVRVHDELKQVKKTVERLGDRWATETGAAKDAAAKEMKRIYRENQLLYAERHAYLADLQAYLANLRGGIVAYGDGARAGAAT